jgi:hypothetical protein
MKRIALFFLIAITGISVHAVNSLSDRDEIVWFGLDYSLVRFIGFSDQFSDLENIRERYFRSWNELILMESDKYDLKGAFGVREVSYDVERAITRSQERDMDGILQSSSYRIEESQVTGMIGAYTDPSDNRIGALMVMETLNKIEEEVTLWLVTFEISSGEVLHIRRFVEEPGGFGFRNYWARGYYNVIKNLKNSPLKPL